MSIRRTINLNCDGCGEIMDAGDLGVGLRMGSGARIGARMTPPLPTEPLHECGLTPDEHTEGAREID